MTLPPFLLADERTPELLHRPRDGARFGQCLQKKRVVVHQYVCMQCAAGSEQRLAQQIQITTAVVVAQEAGQAVIAALDDMLREGLVESELSGPVDHWAGIVAR